MPVAFAHLGFAWPRTAAIAATAHDRESLFFGLVVLIATLVSEFALALLVHLAWVFLSFRMLGPFVSYP